VDCDFEFFFNKSALIRVENNNFIELGMEFTFFANENYVYEGTITDLNQDDYYLGVLGEDRGCRLNITNTTVKNSNFCQGMIVYKKQKVLTFEEEPSVLNYTAQWARVTEYEWSTDRRDPQIIIMDSVFENLAYQERLIALSSLKDSYTSSDVPAISSFVQAEF
jgi:hypothetical protein